jgi:hypothetical protein
MTTRSGLTRPLETIMTRRLATALAVAVLHLAPLPLAAQHGEHAHHGTAAHGDTPPRTWSPK